MIKDILKKWFFPSRIRVYKRRTERHRFKILCVRLSEEFGYCPIHFSKQFAMPFSSVYKWINKYNKAKKNFDVLASNVSKNLRTSKRIILEIHRLQNEYPYVRARKIRKLLKNYCINNNIKLPSENTVKNILMNHYRWARRSDGWNNKVVNRKNWERKNRYWASNVKFGTK